MSLTKYNKRFLKCVCVEVVLYIHTAEGTFAWELLAAFRAAAEERGERIVIGREIKSFKRVLFPLGRRECVFFR